MFEKQIPRKDRGFFSTTSPRLLELGRSFYAVKSRHGASMHGVVIGKEQVAKSTQLHSVVPLDQLPRCRRLLHQVLDLLGEDGGVVLLVFCLKKWTTWFKWGFNQKSFWFQSQQQTWFLVVFYCHNQSRPNLWICARTQPLQAERLLGQWHGASL